MDKKKGPTGKGLQDSDEDHGPTHQRSPKEYRRHGNPTGGPQNPFGGQPPQRHRRDGRVQRRSPQPARRPWGPPLSQQGHQPQQQRGTSGTISEQMQRCLTVSNQAPSQRQKGDQGPSQQQRQTEVLPSTSALPTPVGRGDRLKQMALVKPGTRGKVIKVESNHVALHLGKLLEAVHYDVAITPDTPKSMLRDVMKVFGTKHYPNRHPAFDGRKNLYTTTMLPFGEFKDDTIKLDGENKVPREFKVEVKFARKVDLSPLHDLLRTKASPYDALQCVDIILRNASADRSITAGRCFFTPPSGQIIPLGNGMEMYYGFYQSAIRGWKPLFNVDVAHKAFPMGLDLLDLACELGSDYRGKLERKDLARPLPDHLHRSLDKFIKTLKIKYEIPGQSASKRFYRVNGLGEPPRTAQFKLENGTTSTVEKYFAEKKRVRLQYPHLPTLWVGSRDRQVLLPLEFCSVVEGQVVPRKLNEAQTSAMIKTTATSTDVRKEKIMQALNKTNFSQDPCIREFGLSVGDQFEKLDARVLKPPTLQYSNNTVTPTKGVWRNNRSGFFLAARINKWTIVSVTRQPARVEKLAEEIYKFAGQTGIRIASKASPPFAHIGGRQTIQDITKYFETKTDFDLIFVVVPNTGPQYGLVKQAAELNVGCLTQCIKERTLMKLNPQTVANILLKINSKLNGTNHCLDKISRPPITHRPCMIMGADVTHPSPDSKDIPSVAAVTASHDVNAFQYNICWRLQPPKMEIIEDLCNITMEQLKFFYQKNNGCKPERIVFFRDGVSEGQFLQVQRAEIFAIQSACKKLQSDGYEPTITFLVVQKRHHTRLFPTNPRDSEDKNNNVPAGTCVDTIITNPTMQDFYLVSHASIQGVAKPTKYCTLWDDNNMSHDDIQELTYHLCHMFARCNRSVSYPAPTYYAHLAASRAKVYIENEKLDLDELKKYEGKYEIQENICKGRPMFFV